MSPKPPGGLRQSQYIVIGIVVLFWIVFLRRMTQTERISDEDVFASEDDILLLPTSQENEFSIPREMLKPASLRNGNGIPPGWFYVWLITVFL
jgi:hypothetical protein